MLKPFVAVVFFFFAWIVSRLLYRYIPPGKIRDTLYSPPFWLRDKGGRR